VQRHTSRDSAHAALRHIEAITFRTVIGDVAFGKDGALPRAIRRKASSA
jgi:hypothetical protein